MINNLSNFVLLCQNYNHKRPETFARTAISKTIFQETRNQPST